MSRLRGALGGLAALVVALASEYGGEYSGKAMALLKLHDEADVD